MNILLISDPGSVGGAAKALFEVADYLTRLGNKVIVCTSVYDQLNKDLEAIGIETFACGHKSAMNPKSPYKWKRPLKYPYELFVYYLSLPRAIKKIEEHVDLNKIDVIHTNSSRNDIGCILNKKYNIPHVMHIREFGQEDFDCCIYRPNYYSYISKYTDKFLAISKAVLNSWVSKGIDKNKICLLYDGIDIEKIECKKNYNKENQLKMIFTGGICEPKGQHVAIEALGLLPKEIQENVKLDIIGWDDPKYLSKLKARVKELDIADNVNFIGKKDNVGEILRNYDIGLNCSKSEGFGRVTAEYLYSGICPIVSNRGANPELVENKINGLVFEYPNAKSLADKISMLYIDRNLLISLSKNAHNKGSMYSASVNAEGIIKNYKEVIK